MDAEEVAALEFVLHAVAKSMMVVLNALKYSARENVRSQRESGCPEEDRG